MSLQFLSRGFSRCVLPTASRWAQHYLQPTPQNFAVRTFATKKVSNTSHWCSLSLTILAAAHSWRFQHKNLLKHAKGFRGRAKNCYRIAVRRVHKSWQYAYRDRRRKKREWHKVWIQRIQAGVRQYSFRYSEFFGAYRKSSMQMDRKILADLAATEPFAFRSVVQVVEHQMVSKKSI